MDAIAGLVPIGVRAGDLVRFGRLEATVERRIEPDEPGEIPVLVLAWQQDGRRERLAVLESMVERIGGRAEIPPDRAVAT